MANHDPSWPDPYGPADDPMLPLPEHKPTELDEWARADSRLMVLCAVLAGLAALATLLVLSMET